MSTSSHKDVVINVFNILIKDTRFTHQINTSITSILKDGKIDQYDIPELIFLITNTYNNISSIKLEYDDIPQLIKLLYNHIVNTMNLIPIDKRSEFERAVDSAIRLVMLQPIVAQQYKKCSSCCSIS